MLAIIQSRCDQARLLFIPIVTFINMSDLNAAEKQQIHADHYSDISSREKTGVYQEETAHDAAIRGHVATDSYVPFRVTTPPF